MLAKVISAAQIGIESVPIEVECDMTNGLPGLSIVGMGNKAIEEARDRVRSAIKNTGLMIPPRRITVNLAPADMPKHGTGYDMAMAVSILIASEQIEVVDDAVFIGELALDGSFRSTPGVLNATLMACERKIRSIFVPESNAGEANMATGVRVLPVASLEQLKKHLNKEVFIKPSRKVKPRPGPPKNIPDFAAVFGQNQAKRALEIAAAGNHNILLSGPPGAGKTMLSRATLGLLPDLSDSELLEIASVQSASGKATINSGRPFRAPHHSASTAALIGGGIPPSPGEISLSHRGVLFLDELPEFRRETLEALQQPLEEGTITVARASGTFTYPANFMLIAAQNPCPCGYLGDIQKECTCSGWRVAQYSRKISGPLLDRIDITVNVGRAEYASLVDRVPEESSSDIKRRVTAARKLQLQRLGYDRSNSRMNQADIDQYCRLDSPGKALASQALKRLGLSARSYIKTLKVARTIADLDKEDEIKSAHFAEALSYRPKF